MNIPKNPLIVLCYALVAAGALVLFFKVILPLLIGLLQVGVALALFGALVYGAILLVKFATHKNRFK